MKMLDKILEMLIALTFDSTSLKIMRGNEHLIEN